MNFKKWVKVYKPWVTMAHVQYSLSENQNLVARSERTKTNGANSQS